MQPPTRFNRTRLILRSFGSLLGGGFLIYQIFNTISEFHWSSVMLNMLPAAIFALVFTVFATTLQMIAWKVLLGGIGVNLFLEKVFGGFSLSFVARYIPGTVWGYLARGEWLKRDYQVPFAVSNLGSLIETLGILTAVFVVVILGMLLEVSILLSILLLLVVIIGGWAAMNLSFTLKPVQHLFRLRENCISRFSLFRWLVLVCLYIGMWCCYGMGLSIYGGVIDARVPFNRVLLVNGIYALAWFTGFIVPFLPLGLGLREYSLSILLVANFGLEKSAASLISLGFRLFVSLGEMVWVIFGLIKKAQAHMKR